MRKGKKTELKILNAAAELFVEKGIDRTTVRDISSRAGINLALMNYHFETKENLCDAVFDMVLRKSTEKLVKILDGDLALEAKLKKYVDAYFDLLWESPFLVSFVLEMIQRSKEHVLKIEGAFTLYSTPKFSEQIEDEIKKGNIRPVHPSQIFVDLQSLISFPFGVKLLIQNKLNLDEEGIKAFLDDRKKHIPEMIMAYLKAK
jgi:TetR/AcrR family transcriptional regulator